MASGEGDIQSANPPSDSKPRCCSITKLPKSHKKQNTSHETIHSRTHQEVGAARAGERRAAAVDDRPKLGFSIHRCNTRRAVPQSLSSGLIHR
ncbi:hypothetical protein L1987_30485 [Smallanthus sonchifolius]|uniref:Uncharacterized protein n=1 Tax=Smallanthus sonchifolius TaxID=185202 RepID=A0ACB9I2Y7_9ASTR|nr:hypothetical protein L1987_30485 [Smallanthus sonchifolius]